MARARQRLIKNAMTDDGEPITRSDGQSSSNNHGRVRSVSVPNHAIHSI